MKIPRWLTAQVATLAALGVVTALLVGRCNEVSALRAEYRRSTEAAAIDAAGLQRAREVSEDELRRRGDYLADALEQALKAQGIKSKPAIVIDGTTGPVTVHGSTTGLYNGAAGGASLGPSGSPAVAQAPGAGATSSPSAPGCLLQAGDQGEIRTRIVSVETQAGNLVFAGEASAWRVTANSPQTRLFGGPLRLDVAIPKSETDPRGDGLGIGWALSVSDRFRTGPAIALPTSQWWRIAGDYSFTVQCTPGKGVCEKDTLLLGGQAIWRWR